MTKPLSWTAEEDAVLIDRYPHLQKHELKGLITGKTVEEMCSRAGYLKLKKTMLVRKKVIATADANMKRIRYY